MKQWVAICARCEPTTPRRYEDRDARDTEAGAHNETTGHPILLVKTSEQEEPSDDGNTS